MIIGDDEVGKGDGKHACCISAKVWWIVKIVLSFYLPFALVCRYGRMGPARGY